MEGVGGGITTTKTDLDQNRRWIVAVEHLCLAKYLDVYPPEQNLFLDTKSSFDNLAS